MSAGGTNNNHTSMETSGDKSPQMMDDMNKANGNNPVEKTLSLSDILKAVNTLGTRFDNVETTLKRLNSTVHSHSQKLVDVSSTVEDIDHKMRGLEIENDIMKKEMREMKAKEDKMQDQIFELQQKVNLTYRKANDVEQYTRRENLRIYGIAESGVDEEGKVISETNEQCTQKVLNVLNSQLKLTNPVKSTDLAAAHRIGKYNSKNPNARSIIMRFVSRKTRDTIFKAKSNLKGSKWVITEDLTPYQHNLLAKTKNDTEVCDKAWTQYGKVVMLTHSGKYIQVDSPYDLADPSARSLWSKSRKRNASDITQSPESTNTSPQYVPTEQERKQTDTETDKNKDESQSVSAESIPNTTTMLEKRDDNQSGQIAMNEQTFKMPNPVQPGTKLHHNSLPPNDINLADMQTPRSRSKKMRGSKASRGNYGNGRGRFKLTSHPPKDGLYNYFQNLDSDDSESVDSTASNAKDSQNFGIFD